MATGALLVMCGKHEGGYSRSSKESNHCEIKPTKHADVRFRILYSTGPEPAPRVYMWLALYRFVRIALESHHNRTIPINAVFIPAPYITYCSFSSNRPQFQYILFFCLFLSVLLFLCEEHCIRVSGHVGLPVQHIRLRRTRPGGTVPRFRYNNRRGKRECGVLSWRGV